MGKCAKFNPGDMDKRITFQVVAQVSDGQGGFTEAWADAFEVWAMIEPVKQRERMQAQQLKSPRTHKILVRYLEGVTTKHRIKFETRIFEIKEVLNKDEAKAFSQITCMET